MAGEAGQLAAVRAGFGVAAGVAGLRFAGAVSFAGAGVGPDGAGVDRAEGGGGEGGEHGRVSGDVFGDTFAADQPGAEELEGITAVGLGAGRARGGAAVAAGFIDHAVGQGRGGVVVRISPVAGSTLWILPPRRMGWVHPAAGQM